MLVRWYLNGSGKFDTHLFIRRFGMVLRPYFLGRAFGKSRYLNGWLSLCGQQLMLGFLLWTILCLGVSL